jgi:hypothetical protein
MIVGCFRVLMRMFAVLKRSGSMLFPFLMSSLIMMMRRLMVMVGRGVMVRGCIVVMFTRSVFPFLGHGNDS